MDEWLITHLRSQPLMKRPAALTDEKIRRYTKENQERFTKMLNIDSPFIRRGECQIYLQIWNQIEAMGFDWEKLDNLGRFGLLDCLYDEQEYGDDENEE